MKILAIDPATKCGWAISRLVYGVWDLSTRADESWGMKLLRFETKLNELVKEHDVGVVVYERPGGRFTKPVITQSKIIGIVEAFCEENHIHYRGYSSKEIKKFATGKGNAGKPAMIESAKDKLGYEGNDDNEADALWLLEMAINEYGTVVIKQTKKNDGQRSLF